MAIRERGYILADHFYMCKSYVFEKSPGKNCLIREIIFQRCGGTVVYEPSGCASLIHLT